MPKILGAKIAAKHVHIFYCTLDISHHRHRYRPPKILGILVSHMQWADSINNEEAHGDN